MVECIALVLVCLLDGRLHDAGVHDLPATRDVAVLLQLQAHRVEARGRSVAHDDDLEQVALRLDTLSNEKKGRNPANVL